MPRRRAPEVVAAPVPLAPPPARPVYDALAVAVARHRAEPGRGALEPYELQVFSQNGEDGVIAELLARVGAGERWFVEFGASSGREGTCVLLADVLGFHGLFIEADDRAHAQLAAKYAHHPRVTTQHATVAPENVEELFAAAAVPAEPTVVSIDVDGVDYWVWEALEAYRPRVIVVEYNAHLPPDSTLTVPRDHAGAWDGSDYFGASLGALAMLGKRRGYRLVHTDLAGVNAFFVRGDLGGADGWPEEVVAHQPNYFLAGIRHTPDPRRRMWWDAAAGGLVSRP